MTVTEMPETYEEERPEFRIKIAEKIIAVIPCLQSLYLENFCGGYLINDDAEKAEADFSVIITKEDIERERESSSLEASDQYFETLALARETAESLLKYDTIMFHASCVAVDGEGYCFAAPSGIGKSTHANLWKKQFGDRFEYVNDDKPFLKITDDGVIAYGSPWNGGHHLGNNISVPVKAICILKRDVTNHIEPITSEEAFPDLFGQTYRPHNAKELNKVLELTDRISRQVRLYSLGCNMDPKSAIIAYEGIVKGKTL